MESVNQVIHRNNQ